MIGRLLTPFARLGQRTGRVLARHLERPVRRYVPFSVTPTEILAQVLQPADVLLVDGDQRVSMAIKYLTQSTWSHAALYVGDALAQDAAGEPPVLVEALASTGVVAVPLSKYRGYNTRICRAVDLQPHDRAQVVRHMLDGLGMQYDLKNIFDLARYLLPTPPVPVHWRRRMLALGSGDPTRAICSSLIAQAFQSVRYPILPYVERRVGADRWGAAMLREILHIRHHSLFTPRDFDLSPYFRVVKPTLERGFDYRALEWAETE